MIGIGRWGKQLLGGFVRQADVTTCFYRGDEATTAWLQTNHPTIRRAVSYRSILADPAIDAIAIATPIATHFKLAQQALQAGKHVFVEKAMTRTAREAVQLARLAEQQRRVLAVGYIFLHHQLIPVIERLTRRDPIRHLAFSWRKCGSFREGLIPNLLSHEISIAEHFLGLTRRLTTDVLTPAVSHGDILQAQSRHHHGTASFTIDRTTPDKQKSVTIVTRDTVYTWIDQQLFQLDPLTMRSHLIATATETPLDRECHDFVRSVTKQRQPKVGALIGLSVNRALEKITRR